MGQNISRFLQWGPNVFLYRNLGWRFTHPYLFLLGNLYFALKGQDLRKISQSIEEVFGAIRSPSEIKRIKSMTVQGILSHYFEKIFNAYEGLPLLTSFLKDHVSAPGLHKLDEALNRKKGVLFVTGHYGGVEYIPILIGMHHYPLSVVFKCATTRLQDTLHRKAEDLGIKVIDPSEGNTMRDIMQNLKENRIVMVECDEIEAWRPSPKERMVFLGKHIGVDRAITVLQKRSGAEIVFGLLQRLGLRRYDLVLETYQDVVSHWEGLQCSPAALMLKNLERHIYANPQMWYQWKHFNDLGSSFDAPRASRTEQPAAILDPVFWPAR